MILKWLDNMWVDVLFKDTMLKYVGDNVKTCARMQNAFWISSAIKMTRYGVANDRVTLDGHV